MNDCRSIDIVRCACCWDSQAMRECLFPPQPLIRGNNKITRQKNLLPVIKEMCLKSESLSLAVAGRDVGTQTDQCVLVLVLVLVVTLFHVLVVA